MKNDEMISKREVGQLIEKLVIRWSSEASDSKDYMMLSTQRADVIDSLIREFYEEAKGDLNSASNYRMKWELAGKTRELKNL
jgi:hypothetical protein